jgi:hypothetical protein
LEKVGLGIFVYFSGFVIPNFCSCSLACYDGLPLCANLKGFVFWLQPSINCSATSLATDHINGCGGDEQSVAGLHRYAAF